MSKTNIRLRGRTAAAVILLSALALAGIAVAKEEPKTNAHPSVPRTLHGAYGFSLSQTCVRTPFQAPPASGFDPVTKQLKVDGEFVSGFGSGVLRFERNGIAKIENALITEISASQTAAGKSPVSPGTNFGCSGNYHVQPTGKLTVVLSCEAAPPAAGLRVVIEPVEFEGFVGNGRSINLGTFKRDLSEVTVYSGTTAIQQRQRICLQSLNLDQL